MARNNDTGIEYIWSDRKRVLGMPLTFTKYRLSDDRLFLEKGLLNVKEEEVLLYRIRDIKLTMNLFQRMFGVGNICVLSSDQSAPHLDIVNVKDPRRIKELIHQSVEDAKEKRRVRPMEVMGGEDDFEDPHGDSEFTVDDGIDD